MDDQYRGSWGNTSIVSISKTKDGHLGTLKDKHLIWNSLSTAVVVGLHASAGLRWGSVGVDVPDGEQLKYRLLGDQKTSFFLKGPTWVSRLVEVYQDSMSEESGDPVAGKRRGH